MEEDFSCRKKQEGGFLLSPEAGRRIFSSVEAGVLSIEAGLLSLEAGRRISFVT